MCFHQSFRRTMPHYHIKQVLLFVLKLSAFVLNKWILYLRSFDIELFFKVLFKWIILPRYLECSTCSNLVLFIVMLGHYSCILSSLEHSFFYRESSAVFFITPYDGLENASSIFSFIQFNNIINETLLA